MRNILAITLAASMTIFTSTMTFASPVGIYVMIDCPSIQIQSNQLSNYGDYIAGYGLEKIEGYIDTSVYFKSNSLINGVPADLQNYFNSGVKYTSTTGNVSCSYASNAGEPSFDIVYTLTNGKGGSGYALRDDVISILMPFGK